MSIVRYYNQTKTNTTYLNFVLLDGGGSSNILALAHDSLAVDADQSVVVVLTALFGVGENFSITIGTVGKNSEVVSHIINIEDCASAIDDACCNTTGLFQQIS